MQKILEWRQSPLSFVRNLWGIVPQPLQTGVRDDLEWSEYRLTMFQPFVKGRHLTWQQWLIFRAVEWACQGKSSRRISVSSGHGIGKSATMAMLKLWFLGCFTEPQVPCTANTSDQLSDILWKESKKWLNQMPPDFAAQYDHQSSYIRMKYSPETAFARARTAKKEAPEALAGVHADNVMMLIDEASGVCEEVFETASGSLTNSNIFVIMISNPTRLSGYFYDSHHRNQASWQIMRFDSRESPIVDIQFVQSIIEEYGEDSPQFSTRVRGEFPDSEEDQLIPRSLFDAAAARPKTMDYSAIRCLGIDVARYGGDKTVLAERQGAVMQVLTVRSDQDTVATANDAQKAIRMAKDENNPFDFVFVDIIGIGSGVFDILLDRQRSGLIDANVRFIPVNSSETADEELEHANKRVEMWHRYKKWLEHGSIDPQFREDSCAVKFGKPDSKGRNTLELKEDTKKRLGHSPDVGDAGVMTFAILTGRRDTLPSLAGTHEESEVSFGAFG